MPASSTWSAPRRDAVVVTLLVISVALLCARFEVNERLYGFTAAETRLQAALVDLRELASEQLTSQERERKAFARDLHDDLGQTLLALRLDASMLRRELPAGDLRARADALTAGILQLHERVRSLISQLRPVALDELGLGAALEHFVNFWQARAPKCSLHFLFDQRLDSIGEASALTTYRVVQEAVLNAVRHAQASRINIILREESTPDRGRCVCILVEDDGRGSGAEGPAPGYGLRGMRERIEAAHGTIEFRTGTPTGLVLEAQLPLREAP